MVKLVVIRKAKWRCRSIDEQLGVLPDFLTLRQVRELLGVSDRTLRRVIAHPEARKDLGAFKCGSRWIIPKVGLIEFLQWRNFFNWEETKRRLRHESKEEAGKP
ncbi:helix-turn-helix domain-containing protein [Thermovibrio sp.]